ncbi:MAG: hypothetical protein KF819_36890 [Labilithrix sp.]|nr:hypothetical protein [Labilithrix sp.]
MGSCFGSFTSGDEDTLIDATSFARSGEAPIVPIVGSRDKRSPATIVCVVCLVLGAALGHVVREGRALASDRPRAAVALAPRAPADAKVVRSGAMRSKAEPAAAPPKRTRAPKARPKPAPSVALDAASFDALLADFEPSFRVAP